MDTTAPAPSTTPPSTSATQALITELADDKVVVAKALAAYKSGGLKALAEVLPDIVQEAKEDISAVTAAVPEIKAGYKTTEFWLIVGVLVLNAAYIGFTNRALPLDVNVVLGIVTSVYTVIRGALKKPAA